MEFILIIGAVILGAIFGNSECRGIVGIVAALAAVNWLSENLHFSGLIGGAFAVVIGIIGLGLLGSLFGALDGGDDY